MSPLEFMFVPTILFMVIVAPIWITLHYRSVRRSSRSLSSDDRENLEHMLATVDLLAERIATLESLLDAEHQGWRQDQNQDRDREAAAQEKS
jgi:phage shock protein B